MICGAAGHNMDLRDLFDLFITHVQLFDHNIIILDSRRDGIFDGLRLLIDLFQHEVLISSLFCRIGIPVNGHRLLLDLFLIHGEETQTTLL